MSKLMRLPCLLLLVAGHILSAQSPARKSHSTSSTIYERLLPSTVFVSVSGRDGKQIASGSGVVLHADGLILTNYHVVEGGVFFDVRVAGPSGTISLPARASKCAPEQDLAVLSVTAPAGRLKAVKIATGIPKIGDRVLAIGSPLALEGTLSDGIVSQVRRLSERTLIQTTAPISPGSSGGGLFLADGRLVGVTTLMLKGGQSLNFAVSAQDITSLVPCTSFPPVADSAEVDAEPTPIPTPKPPPCPPKLVIAQMTTSLATTASAGAALGVFSFWVEGLVENRGCTGASYVKVMVKATSPADEFITSGWGYASPERIGPGASSGFKILVDIPSRVFEQYGASPHFLGKVLDDWISD